MVITEFLLSANDKVEQLLRYNIVNHRFMYMDLWSFVHILVGYILAKFIKKPVWVFILLTVYEIFEAIVLVGSGFYQPETLIDSVWDVIFGMIGFFIGWFI